MKLHQVALWHHGQALPGWIADGEREGASAGNADAADIPEKATESN